jgi:hypothetical protein
MSRFAIQQFRFNNTLYPGISGWSVNPGVEINSDQLDGTVHETGHHGMRSAPTAELTTRNLGFLSVLDGSTDAWLKACDGTNGIECIGGKASTAAPGYAAGSVHLVRKMARGFLLGTGINWSKRGKAELTLRGMGLSADGTTAALSAAANIALPTLPVTDYGYILSALTLDGDAIPAPDSVAIACDPRAEFEYLADLPEPTDILWAGVNGAVQWRLNAGIGDCQLGDGTGAVSAVFTRLAQGGGLGTDTLTVTFNSNWSIEEGLSGSPILGRQLVVRPRYNGTTKPVTWAVA